MICCAYMRLLMGHLRNLCRNFMRLRAEVSAGFFAVTTDLYKYSPDAVPPIHAVSHHVATDKPPAQNGKSSGLF